MRLPVLSIIALTLLSTVTEARTYNANKTSSPPTIDGLVDDAEWLDAARQGGWTLLRTPGDSDSENSQLGAVWDDDGLYLLFWSSYSDWNGTNGAINFGGDNLNLIFDPNTDDEANSGTADSYQMAFNQPDGPSDMVEIFAEARSNGNFGNNAAPWSRFAGAQVAQQNSDQGGTAEVFIPWSDFDAGVDGLAHDFVPTINDEWLFNVGRISSSGGLPIYSHHDGQFFAERPMGILRFVPEPSATPWLFCGLLYLMKRRRKPLSD